MNELARFERKYIPEPNSGCWLWQGAPLRGADGREWYGRFLFRGKETSAHRASYMLHAGAIPPGLYVLHKCDNPSCVNPDHLFLGTQADNMRDMARKGRSIAGAKHHNARLTPQQALAIRSDNRPSRLVAMDYGVCDSLVRQIRRRVKWRHLP